MQDMTTLKLYCDCCRNELHPHDVFANLPLSTIWRGEVGRGVAICPMCLEQKLGIPRDHLTNVREGRQ